MRRFKTTQLIRLISFLIVFCSLFFLCIPYSSAAGVNLKFSIILDKAEYQLNEPINATFKLENEGEQQVYINKRFYLSSEAVPNEEREVYLIVISPKEEKLPCKFSYETGLPKSDYFELLFPGKDVFSEFPRNLSGYFDLTEPGEYKFTAVYQNVFGQELGLDVFKEKLVSNPVLFKIVKPEDNAKILKTKPE